MYNTLILIYPENLRRMSFVLLGLQGDATADQNLLVGIMMRAEGSHQVVATWNHVSQWSIPLVLYGCVLAGVGNVATLLATSE